MRFRAKLVACFFSRVGRVQHANYSSDAEPCQEPQKAAAITICHNYLLNFSAYRNGSILICERQFTAPDVERRAASPLQRGRGPAKTPRPPSTPSLPPQNSPGHSTEPPVSGAPKAANDASRR